MIEGLEDAPKLSDKGGLVLSCVSDGEITPAEASSLLSAIASQARILEVDELERRVAALEAGNETQ